MLAHEAQSNHRSYGSFPGRGDIRWGRGTPSGPSCGPLGGGCRIWTPQGHEANRAGKAVETVCPGSELVAEALAEGVPDFSKPL